MKKILFLHGAPGDARVWGPVLEALPNDVAGTAITLSHFGADAAAAGKFGTRTHADDIVRYLSDEMTAPACVVAWSYSVHPTILAAIERPDLFAAIYTYEPGLPTYVSDPADLSRFEADAPAAFGPIASAMALGDDAAMGALFAMSGGEGAFENLPDQRRELYRQGSHVMPLLMGGGEPPAKITAADLASIRCPVRVGLGSRSRDVFAVPSHALATGVPGAQLAIVPDADHLLPEKDPARFAALVADWLKDLESSA